VSIGSTVVAPFDEPATNQVLLDVPGGRGLGRMFKAEWDSHERIAIMGRARGGIEVVAVPEQDRRA